MQSIIRPLIRPLPLFGLSAGSILLVATLTSSSRRGAAMSTSSGPAGPWTVKAYTPRHTSWPYVSSDFARQDPSADTNFYSAPRFVTHIDDAAIASLRQYYDSVLPLKGRVLDFCSSWVSHYPASIERAVDGGELKVVGMGMNEAELERNQFLNGGRVLRDLNVDPDVKGALVQAGVVVEGDGEKLNAATCVVSIDYLVRPVEVLSSLKNAMAKDGTVHLTVSNRCFPTKAMARWLRVSEEERLQMVGDFLYFAGWKQIEIVEISDGTVEGSGEQGQQGQQGGLFALKGYMGMNRRDPLWVVRAVNE